MSKTIRGISSNATFYQLVKRSFSIGLLCVTALNAQAITVNLTQAKAWSGGYLMDGTITNDSSAAINGWSLGFKLGNKIEKMSRATFTGTDPYTVTALSYSADIGVGASEPFSFTAIGNFNSANVGSCVFNGRACNLLVNGAPVGGASSVAASSRPASVAASSRPTSVAASSRPTSVAASSRTASSKAASSTPAGCTLAKPAPNIPLPFGLFTILSKNTERADFCKVAKWYSESDGKQVFRLFKGDNFADNNPGGRSHSRTEAQAPSFKAGSTWHTFEARMQFDTKLTHSMTIAQLFAGCCGPQLRIDLMPTGRINIGSRSNGNEQISDNEDYGGTGKSFKIKIRSNGKDFEVYFNGVKKFTGKTEESQQGNDAAAYHFRWGVYGKSSTNFSNTVTEILRD